MGDTEKGTWTSGDLGHFLRKREVKQEIDAAVTAFRQIHQRFPSAEEFAKLQGEVLDAEAGY